MLKNGWNQNLFYFPTTVIVLDDDEEFLKIIQKFLNSNDILAKTYSDVNAFCKYITHKAQPIKPDDLFLKKEEDYYQGGTGVIRTDTGAIYKIIYNNERFNQVAVAIVDYELQGETGIDVCSSIKSSYVKKIMLTGKAGYKVAIDAMNNKIIDAYVEKSDIGKLIEIIKALEIEHFCDLSKKLQYVCNFSQEPFLANLIDMYIKQYQPVEYYIFNNSKSFLFLNEYSDASGLFIEEESTIAHIEKILEIDNVSPAIYLPICARKAVPARWNLASYLINGFDFKMVDCSRISGNHGEYYYYYLDDLEEFSGQNDAIMSFREKMSDHLE